MIKQGLKTLSNIWENLQKNHGDSFFRISWKQSLFLPLLFFISCNPFPQRNRLSHTIWIPWPNAQGQYSVQKVQVDTVSSWSPLRGSAAKLQSHGTLRGDILSSQEVVMEFTQDRSGVMIPLTQFSVEVSSIYANFERLQKKDIELGIPEADVARKVFIRFRSRNSGLPLANNALYFLDNDSFFIMPYESNKLPISVNGSILAHEHFHSIFARLLLRPLIKEGKLQGKNVLSFLTEPHDTNELVNYVKNGDVSSESTPTLKPNPEETSKVNPFSEEDNTNKLISPSSPKQIKHVNMVFIMALNEGLADVWAWLYSHNPCFIAPSLDLKSDPTKIDDYENRCLSTKSGVISPFNISTLNYINNDGLEKEEDQMRRKAYHLGTHLARMIYRRMEERGELDNPNAIQFWSKHIVETLPQFLPEMLKVYVTEDKEQSLFSWDQAIDKLLFGPGTPNLPEGACERWTQILLDAKSLEHFSKNCASR